MKEEINLSKEIDDAGHFLHDVRVIRVLKIEEFIKSVREIILSNMSPRQKLNRLDELIGDKLR